jgi:protein disulfide-isomerase
LEGAKRLAAQNNQLVLVHFWAPYCGVCRRMEEEVFPDPRVARVIQSLYVPVKLNTEYFPSTANQYGITKLPTDIILSPSGQLLQRVEGYEKAPDYASLLMQVAGSARPAAATPAVFANTASPATGQPTANPNAPAPWSATPQLPAGGNPYAGAGTSGATNTAATSPSFPPNASAAYGMPYSGQPMMTAAANVPQAMQPAPTMPPIGSTAVPTAIPGSNAAGAPGLPAKTSTPNSPLVVGGNGTTSASPAAPLALDGFCPVELMEHHSWVAGDKRWGVVHLGRTYLFAGPEQWQRFFANPEKYAPALSGLDVVLAIERNQFVPGDRRYGGYYDGKLYLFSSEETLQKFDHEPHRYANAAAQSFRVTQVINSR